MVSKCGKIQDIENEVKKSRKIRINEIKAAKILDYDIQLNKEKFNNLDWIEYKNFIMPNMYSKLSFIYELKEINHWHNFLIKNLLKRKIYKKFGLDDYQIHKDVVFYFERVKSNVELLIPSFIRYYNGNIKNYKKNVNIYFNKLKGLIYTKYYLNEEEKRKKEKEYKDADEEKRRKEREKRKTQEELDKEMWEYKREGEKINNYFNENYLNFRNEYWCKDNIPLHYSINSLGNFT